MLVQTSTVNHHPKNHAWCPARDCIVCGSKAIGINFGVPTCAPCKAFFRRNARRKEVLQSPCQFHEIDLLAKENDEQCQKLNYCSQTRHCTSCRLRRCFDVGMKEELVRTDEEKQRYKQLIQANRQRRRKTSHEENLLIIPRLIVRNDELSNEIDWTLLSNIVDAYDNHFLKLYTQNHKKFFHDETKFSDDVHAKLTYHAARNVNIIGSFVSFLSSMPIIQSLPNDYRIYLCKHNVRSLIFPNAHEIEQTCFTESWQIDASNISAEYVFGTELYLDHLKIKIQARKILINDPAVTRLWLLVLLFSTPLMCYYNRSLPNISHESRLNINKIQNSYITLLWNYLVHRHGYLDAGRIYSNLIRIYLQIQRIAHAINVEVRTRSDLLELNQAFDRAAITDSTILL